MYLMKHLSALSLKSIGMRFGNRDHSTVIHAIRIIEREVERDPSFARQMESLKSLVKD
jgi:chromosomal replication initiator protein